MDKMKMESVNMTEQNIERIGALFPNCITEMLDEEKSISENKVYKKAVNFEMLKQMLSSEVIDGDEAYEFTWVGKKASIVEANKPIRKTLRPCPEESANWDETENLYIEGDNLEVLKLLQESYLGKVKMIYIDPPYNTGKDSFLYPDNFSMSGDAYEEEIGLYDEDGNKLFTENSSINPRFHSTWCSMIYSRLMLARNMLSDDGVIFISIDEKEITCLTKICDEIFGSSNHLETFHIQVRYGNKSLNEDSDFQPVMEYVLIYCKDKTLFVPQKPSEPYDLSKVLFIATANDLGGIPGPLRDRLEIIEVSSYTEQEKLMIVKEHLIKKQLDAHSLKPEQMIISDDIIMEIIQHYTREAGVRELERYIAKLCRKTVLAILKEKVESVTIDQDKLVEFLGKAPFDHTKKLPRPQVGVVTGMAYTQFGGDILPIEVNHFDGTGKFIITGQLGDVMKESASIALDYLKANKEKYGLDDKAFDKQDIHIHVPEGAIKKDGPSAGVTLTTAIYSAFTNKPVRDDVAMTGEITLRGNVLPIGGLKEKSISAHRSGIRKIIIPKENEKDIEDIPESVRNDLEIVLADHIDVVLEHAIVK